MAASLLLPILLTLLPFATAITATTTTNAAVILSDSGFISMSLTLPFLSPDLLSSLSSATLFTPSDSTFSLSLSSPQPPFSLLLFHLCPFRYSPSHLRSLAFAARIRTLNPNFTIAVTSDAGDDVFSLNGVPVDLSPVFDDGYLSIYKIDRFLNPNFTLSLPDVSPSLSPNPNDSAATSPAPIMSCEVPERGYEAAMEAMRSGGYATMAEFLDLQMFSVSEGVKMTIFAPRDSAIGEGQNGNFSEAVRLYKRHVVACEVKWSDFIGKGEKIVLKTLMEGYVISVSGNGDDDLVINGQIKVALPPVYSGDGVVVYGLSQVLEVNESNSGGGSYGGGGGGGSYGGGGGGGDGEKATPPDTMYAV